MRFYVAAVVCLLLAAGLSSGGPQDTVEIPDSAKELKNPVTSGPEALSAARVLWKKHCETCHGVSGRGDGPNARLHEQRKHVAPKDLTDAAFQKDITDGEIYWRITNGLIDDGDIIMPAYRQKVPNDQDRWQLVVFVRELGKARAEAGR